MFYSFQHPELLFIKPEVLLDAALMGEAGALAIEGHEKSALLADFLDLPTLGAPAPVFDVHQDSVTYLGHVTVSNPPHWALVWLHPSWLSLAGQTGT